MNYKLFMIGGILDGRVLESLRYRNGTTFKDDAMLKQRLLIDRVECTRVRYPNILV